MSKFILSGSAEILAATRKESFRRDLKNAITSYEITTIVVDGNFKLSIEPLNKKSAWVALYVDEKFYGGLILETNEVERIIIKNMRTAWKNKNLVFNFPLLPF